MIEFLVGLVALIFVGGFINAYRQSNAKRLADDERERAKQEHQIQINAWRAAWEPTVDRTRWIPKSKAASHAPCAPTRTQLRLLYNKSH